MISARGLVPAEPRAYHWLLGCLAAWLLAGAVRSYVDAFTRASQEPGLGLDPAMMRFFGDLAGRHLSVVEAIVEERLPKRSAEPGGATCATIMKRPAHSKGTMARSKLLHFGGMAVFCLSLSTPSFAQDCKPLEPSKPIDSETANKTRANANILLRSLGSGEIENQYRRIQTDVLNRYPNADRVHIWNSFVYLE